MSITIAGNVGWTAVPNALGRSRLPHTTLHLLMNLLTHADNFVATYRVISDQTGMSSRTISNALKNLQLLELVTVKKVPGMNGRFDGNEYTFHADRLFQITPEFVDEKLRGATAVPADPELDRRCNSDSGTAVETKAAPLSELKRIEEQVENHERMTNLPPNPPAGGSASGDARGDARDARDGRSAEDEFAEWYASYPRKRARGDAAKAFKTARKKATLAQLLDGVQRSIAQWDAEGRDATKLPYPATWLRAESWADQDDQWVSSQPQLRSGAQNTLDDWLGTSSTNNDAPALAEGMQNDGHDFAGGEVIDHYEVNPTW